jgi:hypothetical protein
MAIRKSCTAFNPIAYEAYATKGKPVTINMLSVVKKREKGKINICLLSQRNGHSNRIFAFFYFYETYKT